MSEGDCRELGISNTSSGEDVALQDHTDVLVCLTDHFLLSVVLNWRMIDS